jgi:hypothetical protein
MVKLNWNGKNESKKEFLKNHKSFPFQIINLLAPVCLLIDIIIV